MEIPLNDLSPRQFTDLHTQIEAEFATRVLALQSKMITLSTLDPLPKRSEALSNLPERTQEVVKLVGSIQQDNPLVHCKFVDKIKGVLPGFKLEWRCNESTDLSGISLDLLYTKSLPSSFGTLVGLEFHRRSGSVAILNNRENDFSDRTRIAIPTILGWGKVEQQYLQLELITELVDFLR